MRGEQAALVRLLLVCAAWAVGETLTYGLSLGSPGLVIAAALAVPVFVLTGELGRPRRGGDNVRYWRGRRIDDDEPRGRWN